MPELDLEAIRADIAHYRDPYTCNTTPLSDKIAGHAEVLLAEIEQLQELLSRTRFSEQVAHESALRQIDFAKVLTEKWVNAAQWEVLWKRAAKHYRRRQRAGGRALTKAMAELREARAELEQIRSDPQGIGDVLAAVGAWYEMTAGLSCWGADENERKAGQAILDAYDKFLG